MKLEKKLAQNSPINPKLNPLYHAIIQREKWRRRKLKRLARVHK